MEKKTMQVAKYIVMTAVLALLASAASAGPFRRVMVFGDSTVDTGWYKIDPWSGSNAFDVPYLQHS
jgi:hypothetical protein